MRKLVMFLLVPVIGAVAFLASSPAQLVGPALGAGGAGNNGGGTKLYAADGMDVQIYVDPVNGTLAASGAMGTARSEPFAPATTQSKEIGCWTQAAEWGAMMTCQAITNAGAVLRCSAMMTAPFTGDQPEPWANGMGQAMATMNDDSYITFITDLTPGGTGIGGCMAISIDNNSKYFPRVP